AKVLSQNAKIILTAVPEGLDVFSNWTGSANSTNNPLKFDMEAGSILQANFVPNPFLAFIGSYNGLFFDTNNGITESTAGMIKGLTLNSKGKYSGSLLLNGTNHGFAGAFNLF